LATQAIPKVDVAEQKSLLAVTAPITRLAKS
jgi:hypothetical protein